MNDELTEAELAELAAIEAAMTPATCREFCGRIILNGKQQFVPTAMYDIRQARDDAYGFAAIRNAFPRLIAEIRRLQSRLAELQDAIADHHAATDSFTEVDLQLWAFVGLDKYQGEASEGASCG